MHGPYVKSLDYGKMHYEFETFLNNHLRYFQSDRKTETKENKNGFEM